MKALNIDCVHSATRIDRDVETLAGPAFTLSQKAICRYAYTDEYRNTIEYLCDELKRLQFETYEDPVGTLIARNRPSGQPVFGIGSHCDSNRNGGKYDGTLGMATALEVCRLNAEHELGLPLQVISFLEEEGSGFGQMLLGSRIAVQRVTEEDLRENFRAIDDGRSFWDHARAAGHEPERWKDSVRILSDLIGWIEVHIEQGRVLQDTEHRIGIVTAIAGYVHADISIEGRADHAGATPMDVRLDVAPACAEIILHVERLARKTGGSTVATVGEIEFEPGLINVVPGAARLSLDARGVEEHGFRSLAEAVAEFAERAAGVRGLKAKLSRRQDLPVTRMNDTIVTALEGAARESGEPYMLMPSGAAHDTMCVADRVPSGLVFVPCKDGISHSPDEQADPADAALAAQIIVNAIRALAT